MHAANLGHPKNYSGNLRRPVVSILELLMEIQTLWIPDSFIYNNAPTFVFLHTVLISNKWINTYDPIGSSRILQLLLSLHSYNLT